MDDNHPRLKILQRAVQYLNNGEDVYFAKYDYRKKGINIPEIMYINSAFDCSDDNYKTVAVFNNGETVKRITFTNEDIGLSEGIHQVEFVWEQSVQEMSEYSFTLKPHQSVLLKIKK